MDERSVKEILAKMSFKEKCDYIFEYYKIPIIIVIVLVLFIGSFVHGQVTKKDVYLNITYLGSYIPDDDRDNIRNELNSILVDNTNSQTINLDSIDLDNNQFIPKFQAELASGEIDFAIVNQDTFDKYYSEIFSDLNSVDGFSELSINDDDLVKKDNCTYGVKIKNLNILNKLNEDNDDDKILVAITNSKNKNKLIDLIKKCGN